VVVARNGNLLDVAVAESSGHAKIDAAELEAVRQAAPFPPLPPEVPAGTATLLMPVNYLTVSRK